MTINEYISQHQTQPVDPNSSIRPGFVPAALAGKFRDEDDVSYHVTNDQSRWVGICRARNFFAASNPGVAITTGTLDRDYPTLNAF